MPGQIIAADTIFDHPLYSEWNPSPSNDTPLGGRLMSSSPHVDGLVFLPAGACIASSANLVLTRNGTGDWSFNRTAAGAETYYVRGLGNDASIIRIGERYILDLFPANNVNFTENPAAPAKGIAVLDMFVVFNFGVVLPTAATLRLGTMQYGPYASTLANTGSAPTQVNLVAATSVLPTALTTASQYVTQAVTVPTPGFTVSDLTALEWEFAFSLASTGTCQIAGVGAHVNFNYN